MCHLSIEYFTCISHATTPYHIKMFYYFVDNSIKQTEKKNEEEEEEIDLCFSI